MTQRHGCGKRGQKPPPLNRRGNGSRAKISDTEKQLNRANRDNELLQETNSKISENLESSLALQASLQRKLSSAKENLQTEQTARQQAETAAKNAKERRILADRHREKAEKENAAGFAGKNKRPCGVRMITAGGKFLQKKPQKPLLKRESNLPGTAKMPSWQSKRRLVPCWRRKNLQSVCKTTSKAAKSVLRNWKKPSGKPKSVAKANSLSHYILQKLQARDRARENSQIPESDIPNKENNRQ